MEVRITKMTMYDRVYNFGTRTVKASDGSGARLISSTGIPLNECCGCVNEESCSYLVHYGAVKMPCETEGA